MEDQMTNSMVRELGRYLEEEILNHTLDREIDPDEDLLGTELVDSMGMLRLVGFIEERFQIKVQPEDQVIENFMNLGSIVRFIQGKQGGTSGS